MMCQSICFSCRWSQKLTLYSVKIISINFFSKTQLAMQLPGLSVSFHIGLHGELTYGRSDGSDVITNPKFLALMGLPFYHFVLAATPGGHTASRQSRIKYHSSFIFVWGKGYSFKKQCGAVSVRE